MVKNLKSLAQIEIYFNGQKLNLVGEYFDGLGTYCNLAQVVTALNKYVPADSKMKVEGKGKYITIKTASYGNGPDKKTTTANTNTTKNFPLKGLRIAAGGGHGDNYNYSPVTKNYNEGSFVRKVAEEFLKLCKEAGAEVLNVRPNATNVPIADRNKKVNNFKANFYFDFHTNALGNVPQTKASGTLILNSVARPNHKLAVLLAQHISKAFGVQNRGLWERKNNAGTDYYGSIRGTTNYSNPNTGCITVIGEALFHDNPKDVEKLLKSNAHITYAKAAYDALVAYVNNK